MLQTEGVSEKARARVFARLEEVERLGVRCPCNHLSPAGLTTNNFRTRRSQAGIGFDHRAERPILRGAGSASGLSDALERALDWRVHR